MGHFGIAIDTWNPVGARALVVTSDVLAVALGTGDRRLLSSAFSSVGLGVPLEMPAQLFMDPTRQVALVTDYFESAVTAVDLGSGDRTLISGRNANDPSAVRGTGPALVTPQPITGDRVADVAYVGTSTRQAITAVDVVSGDRVLVSR